MTSKYISSLIILISIICLAFISNDIVSVNESLVFKKYEIESATVKYIVKQNNITKCTLEVKFSNYGAFESISFNATNTNNFKYIAVKHDSIQTCFFQNKPMPLVQKRKNDYLIESMVSNENCVLYEGIRLNKKSQKRYLKKKCDHYYDFKLKKDNKHIDGEITYFKGVPLFAKGGIKDTISGIIELYEINAILFDEK